MPCKSDRSIQDLYDIVNCLDDFNILMRYIETIIDRISHLEERNEAIKNICLILEKFKRKEEE